MLTIIPGDDHYLGITLLISTLLQLTCFAISYTCQFDLITDFAGSTNFILVVLLAYCAGGTSAAASPRAAIATALVLITRAELAAFLLYRCVYTSPSVAGIAMACADALLLYQFVRTSPWNATSLAWSHAASGSACAATC